MFRRPYTIEEMRFAGACRVFLRWHTHCWRPMPGLPCLDRPSLQALVSPHAMRVLKSQAEDREVAAILAMPVGQPIAEGVSKTKGAVSKWLRDSASLTDRKLLGDGYFACTVGDNTRSKVESYLERQGTHHGYAQRVIPPIFVHSYACGDADESRLQPHHAHVLLRFHVVLATMWRKGVFGRQSGPRIAAVWHDLGVEKRFLVEKVSFVPDHVHIALRLHPAISPTVLAVDLMNAAEILMHREFPEHLIQSGASRLWQPSAYIGTYGDVTSEVVQRYIARWRGR